MPSPDKRNLPRRNFLRATGVALSVPMLPSLQPEARAAAKGKAGDAAPRRLVAMNAPLGIHTPLLFPEQAGKDYKATPYLEPLQVVRDKLSVLSGLQHPGVDGGHDAERSFLTAQPHPSQPSFKNSISVDQFAAERIGHLTRFPFMVLGASGRGISYTRSGVMIPTESRPSRMFKRLFMEGTKEEKADNMRRIKDGQSILDLVREQTAELKRKAGRDDSHTLDQYFSSVRELEQRMVYAEQWANKPKPKVDQEPLTDIDDRANFTGRQQLFYDLMLLALQTDSTRLITLNGPGGNEVVNLKGVDDGWHNLSHHGKDENKIKQLAIIEKEEMRLLAAFLKKLEGIKEGDHTLLDNTAVLMGSNLGNASSHNNRNLPIITAGGRMKHAGHLKFDEEKAPPLANLLVSYLQHLGLEVDEFASGTGTMTGLAGA